MLHQTSPPGHEAEGRLEEEVEEIMPSSLISTLKYRLN
jgi:hypothetical protein